ncbi:MAG: carboxymuconolactone decarboxylase family protein [Rhodothermales bacterium]
MVPNLYATYAHSPVALKAILQFDETLKGGSFTKREAEAIALAIAETNACDYCLAAHTAIGKMNGFTEAETIELRTLSSSDEKPLALTSLTQAITITRGRPEESSIQAFYNAGYDKAALVELIGFVSVNTYNNYLNNIAETVIDFPEAPALAVV